MDASAVAGLLDAVKNLSMVSLLAFIIISGAKGGWYFGHQYRKMEELLQGKQTEIEFWRSMALRGVETGRMALNVAERAASAGTGSGV